MTQISDRWIFKDGNWSLNLGKGIVKVNINWRMTNPTGWDVWINGERIEEAVSDIQKAKDLAIKNIEHRSRMLIVQLGLQ